MWVDDTEKRTQTHRSADIKVERSRQFRGKWKEVFHQAAQSRSTLQSVSAAASKSVRSDKRLRLSVTALHDSLHFLKGNMMEFNNAVWERSSVCRVGVCVSLHPPAHKLKWIRRCRPQMSKAIGAGEWKQLGQFYVPNNDTAEGRK